jgi:leader peptidase (prepilin peptidase)/N-methyltransferase
MNLELSILLSVFALSVGSFVNSFIYRFPLIDSNKDLNLFKPRSFCPKCKSSLKPFMLIPIISYIYLKGNCGFCNEKISPSYLIHELFHFVLMALIIVFGSWNPGYIADINILKTLLIFLVLSFFYTQAILDYKHLILSVGLNVCLIGFSLVLNNFFNFMVPILESALGVIFGYSSLWLVNKIYYLIRKKEGIGGGDFLLFAACGSLFGVYALGPILLLGSSVTLLLYSIKKTNFNQKLPLGTGIVSGTGIYFLIAQLIKIY